MKKRAKKSKQINTLDFFCIGFGAIVGVGWAVSINSWMIGSGGPLPAAAGYILAMILMIPVSLCYCELCSMLPVSGGGMSYAFRAFGDNIAFLSGWASFGAFITIIPWESIYVVDIMSIIFPVLTSGSPLYTIAGTGIYPGHIIIGTAISVVLYFVNRKGVAASASLQKILCLILLGAGVLAMICGLLNFSPEHLQPIYEGQADASHSSFIGGALTILASAPFFLAGFETIPQGIESAGAQSGSVGKTVVVTVVLSCVFYAVLLVTLGGAMPWKDFAAFEAPSAALLFRTIYSSSIGSVLYYVILFGALCGLITTWNGFMMAASQILMSMAKVSIVPNRLASVDPKNGTPSAALKICLIASVAGPFLGSGLIGSLTTFSAAGYVLSWVLTAFCLIRLRKVEPDTKRPYKIPGGLFTAWFAAVSMSALMILLLVPGQPVFMGKLATTLFFAWMLCGLGLYLADFRQRQRYSKLKRASILFASMIQSADPVPEYMSLFEADYKILSFVVPDDADYSGRNINSIGWGLNRNIYIIKIEHHNELVVLPNRNNVLCSGDRVFALGKTAKINSFRNKEYIGDKYTITSLKDFLGYGEHEKQASLSCKEVKVSEKAFCCGKQLKDSGIQNDSHCIVVGIRKTLDTTLMPSATTRIDDGDTLWIVGSDRNLKLLSEEF